ncbi:MAG: Gfo/Idh/MocA family oxidoreductase [Dysgonamonadaceae bacterium]|jgi:hypothetical protein|nr:Gfo/Idh/MocA family oxidoreductase [Dysgonamonadaceae bacterium]
MSSKISRRKFLASGAVAAAGLTIVPSTVLGKSMGYKAPSDKLNIVGVGVGGRGRAVLRGMNSENIVGLCDTDHRYAQGVFGDYPNAERFFDYREMYEKLGSSIDAVMVAGSDHTHAIQAADAITMGKHVYVEKPLTHNVYESRLLTKLAEKHKIATQMGNQGSSGPGVRQVIDWIQDGQIGEITRVDAFTDRPIWPQGLNRPTEVMRVPRTMRWDLFVGPAPMRPFNSIYTPWNFRGWWDFGTGALGDMACHVLHPVFKALNLGYPTKVQGSSTLLLTDCAPVAQKVKLTFPARKNLPKIAFPEVEVNWYDGGLLPDRPEGIPAGHNLNDAGGGVIFYGTKDILVCGCYGVNPWLVSGRKPESPQTQRVVTLSHYEDWVRACKESPANRVETASYFGEAGPFNEMVVMGVLAVRLQSLNQELHWDGENMKFTNIPSDATIRTIIEDKFSITDGHPSFDRAWTDRVNANQFAESLINSTYQNGFRLPAMP